MWRNARGLVGKRDVDELIETTRTKKGGVDVVRPVGGANDKDV